MKSAILIVGLLGLSVTASAQFELKSNPVALIFELGVISLEVSNLDDWGGQLDIYAGDGGGLVYGTAKYYLSPKYGADRFHFGAFAGSYFADEDSNFGLGFMVGYKALSKKRVVFEIGGGVGRAFGSDSDIEAIPYFNLNLGYRFLSQKNKSKIPAN